MNPSRTGYQIAKTLSRRPVTGSIPSTPQAQEERNIRSQDVPATPLQQVVHAPVFVPSSHHFPVSYPVYAPVAYYPPVAYPIQTPMMGYAFHNYFHSQPRFPRYYSTVATPIRSTTMSPQMENFAEFEPMGFSTISVAEGAEDGGRMFDVRMSFEQLYGAVKEHLENHRFCRLSWVNRLLAKTNTEEEFDRALQIFSLFQSRSVDASSETGTLLIKAACRAGVPEKALALLEDMSNYRIWPTLGGVHYLMINFSLKKDTASVMKAFEATKKRGLKPTTRTYHILIRECVDNDLIDDAMKFAAECKESNIIPNRVTYNILMNGCRKFNKPEGILQLREQMNGDKIEINDTTVKFTTLAHMMMGNADKAVEAFLEYPEISTKLEEFCQKFFEVTLEDSQQKKYVIDLFDAIQAKGTTLPDSIHKLLAKTKSSLEEKAPEEEVAEEKSAEEQTSEEQTSEEPAKENEETKS